MAHGVTIDYVPCRGLPNTWSDPIMEVPMRTRGVALQQGEVSPASAPNDNVGRRGETAQTIQEPIGTRAAAPVEHDSSVDLGSGYLPWEVIQDVRDGVLALQEALPAHAEDLRVEAWLELVDTFLTMRDFETAEKCFGNALERATVQQTAENYALSPVSAILPPLMPSTSTSTEAADIAEPEDDVSFEEDWTVIELSAESLTSLPIELDAQDASAHAARSNVKPARGIAGAFGLRAITSRFQFLVR
ncbi:hypothetical protein AURDEDRAFT_167044 [Auricularia subglabra TFB-10046 SS5]|nr:hypothetical protein AURDEDRAFT_167044 [Auricularia subglabra TFB-10046 SS5]